MEDSNLHPRNLAGALTLQGHIKPDIPASVPGGKKGNEYEKTLAPSDGSDPSFPGSKPGVLPLNDNGTLLTSQPRALA